LGIVGAVEGYLTGLMPLMLLNRQLQSTEVMEN